MAKDKKTLQVKLAMLGLQKTTISMGFSHERTKSTSLDDLDHLLVATALKVKLIPAKDVEGQSTMFDEDLGIEFTAESNAIRLGADHISGSLRIPMGHLSINKFLKHFANKTAKLILERTGDAKAMQDPELPEDDEVE